MIYFDAGATTLEKPEAVRTAVEEALMSMSSPGRGGHPAAQKAEETAFACRKAAAALFGVESPENVIFTFNATHGLNIAIKSLVKPGSRVVISGYEHNAVTRPLNAMENIEITVIDTPLFRQDRALEEFCQALHRGVDVVICTHVSNVFGYILPMDEIAAECRRRGVPLIVDASQSAGVLPVRMDRWKAAFIAMPGHKGLYGPQGTGLLLCADVPAVPVLEGGTGSLSLQQTMPEDLPDRLEAGTHNMPGVAGLLEGLRFVRRLGTEQIAHHECRVMEETAAHLRQIPNLRLYLDETMQQQTGVFSFVAEGRDCEEIAAGLAARGIAVRAGLHCAPLAHRTAGTLQHGTIRVSTSVFNTLAQAKRFAQETGAVIRENARF